MSRPGNSLVRFSVDHPVIVTVVMLILTVVLGLAAALPTLWPGAFGWLHPLKVDTDPENMLATDEPVRLFHHEARERFSLNDIIVLGVVNEHHAHGVFNVETLGRVYELTDFVQTLRGEAIGAAEDQGVVTVDLIAPSTVDYIENAGLGTVRFDWLMPRPPETSGEALAVRDRARRIPFLNGTLVADQTDKALALYIPLTKKDLAHRVSIELRRKIAELGGDEQYHITGLPVAEDTFGVEMFKQMAISAPLAMVVIFILMWVFFRKLTLIVPPMIMAAVTAILTMALLIVTGNTVHIMSSMIRIFIMPIAVLDAIHIISDFFDRYGSAGDRRETMLAVMDDLFRPMLYTSLTTTAGFASLALTPIPPVQVFGIFVGVGVMLAWFWTITFIPAATMFIPERRLKSIATAESHKAESHGPMGRMLNAVGRFTYRYAWLILAATAIVGAISAWGISRININDNPTRWFEPSHPIRVADRVLNEHFGGTYMAYLQLAAASDADMLDAGDAEAIVERARQEKARVGQEYAADQFEQLASEIERRATALDGPVEAEAFFEPLKQWVERRIAAEDERFNEWNETAIFIEAELQRSELCKDPQVLRWMRDLQDHLETVTGRDGEPIVGKSNSLADIVMTVHRDLLDGSQAQYRVPDRRDMVAQTLIQYQSSHRYNDLWHFVTPDYRTTSLWLQLTSGDNRDMERVVGAVDAYVADNPAPAGLQHDWFGLTYINVVWQDKMVSGMLQAFLGSFLVVLLMMILLFRSGLWGLLSMVPLTVTVALIYGLIGIVGKDYDMPVAVLSSLSLGLAIDYAIHFLARGRAAAARHGSWQAAVGPMFGEPARAITRNAIVVGVGFGPLLAAPLVPYQTVGIFIAAILLTAGAATLLILPALVRLLRRLLFPTGRAATVTCNCGTCIVAMAALVAAAAINIHQFLHQDYTHLTWYSLAAIPVLAAICFIASRRAACRTDSKTA